MGTQACDDKIERTVVERDANFRVIKKILVRLGHVRLKGLRSNMLHIDSTRDHVGCN